MVRQWSDIVVVCRHKSNEKLFGHSKRPVARKFQSKIFLRSYDDAYMCMMFNYSRKSQTKKINLMRLSLH